MTGRKRQQKLYRHHTGYPGGLKEFTFKEIVESNPERILTDAVSGMLPKNKLRKDIIAKNLVMFRGPYHTYHHVGLPQFTEPKPRDINEEMGLDGFSKDTHVVTYTASRDGSVPEEFKDLPQEIDPSIGEPLLFKEKTHTEARENFYLGHALKKSYKNLRRFKVHSHKKVKKY